MPSASAFVQQHSKIKPDALKAIFDGFTDGIMNESMGDLPVLAVDGSDIQIATNPNDEMSYFPGTNGQKSYNPLHLNALYDLKQHLYTDAIIQERISCNEHSALQEMITSHVVIEKK